MDATPLLTLLLAVLVQVSPSVSTVPAIQIIINALIVLLPTVIKDYPVWSPMVKLVISGLAANSNVIAGQRQQLADLDAKIDAALKTSLAGILGALPITIPIAPVAPVAPQGAKMLDGCR